MNNRLPVGFKVFAVIYNMLGFVGLTACVYGFMGIANSDTLMIGTRDYTQMIVILVTVFFFLSSFLILSRRKLGVLIPVFLLTFFIAGGFLVLLPILIAHLIYFQQRQATTQLLPIFDTK